MPKEIRFTVSEDIFAAAAYAAAKNGLKPTDTYEIMLEIVRLDHTLERLSERVGAVAWSQETGDKQREAGP